MGSARAGTVAPPQPPGPGHAGPRFRWQAGIALALATAVLLVIHYRYAITVYPYDSADYWALATAPQTLLPESVIRGYLFPLILQGFVSVGAAAGMAPVDAFRVFSSLAYAAALTWLVPATFSLLSGGRLGIARRLGPFVLVAAMFPGLLLYPLSDLPALAFMWLCVYCLLKCRESSGREFPWAVLAGLAAGAAYNTRIVYLFAILVVAMAVLLQFRGRGRGLACLACGAIGFAIASLPQMAINLRAHGVASPNPAAAYVHTSPFSIQLTLGVSLQKYESSIAGDAGAAAVSYVDPAGQLLLAEICKQGPIAGIGDYLFAVLRHPVEFMGLYARHFINGLDVRDGRVYLDSPATREPYASLACITLMLLMLLAIKSGASVRGTPAGGGQARWNWLYPAALVLPALAATPGAIETRFMLPLLLYLFASASASVSVAAMAADAKPRLHFYAPLALAACAVFFAVTQSTQAHGRRAASTSEYNGCQPVSLNIHKN